jgi:hypothetical protein
VPRAEDVEQIIEITKKRQREESREMHAREKRARGAYACVKVHDLRP